MDMLKKIFPFSNVKEKDVKALVISIVIYIVASAVINFVLSLIGKLPLVGIVTDIVGWAVGVYCLVGIVLAVLNFLNALKK